MNTSILVASFKYLNKKLLRLTISLASWIYNELFSINYENYKLNRAFNNKDFESAESLACLTEDKLFLSRILSKIFDFNRYEPTKCQKIKILLQGGADIHYFDDRALRYASRYGYIEVAKFLLESGANVHAKNNFSLRFAIRSRWIQVVKLLLDAGADVHCQNDFVIRQACEIGDIEIIKLLIQYHADVRCQNDLLIRKMCLRNKITIVKLLIEAGANIYVNENEPLKIARHYKYKELSAMLIKLIHPD